MIHPQRLDRLYRYADRAALGAAAIALTILAIRAAVRLELRWDTFAYHIPFAARRAGLGIPYEISDTMRDWYAGFPPLVDFVQGVLWRLTGSINATGLANYLALLVFLLFCHRQLKASPGIVALIALTAPLVLIHTTTSYADLFGNAFLAIGAAALVAMYFDDRLADRRLLIWALVGFAAAAWSKFQMAPVAAVGLAILILTHGRRWTDERSRRLTYMTLAAALIAAMPYLKNVYCYHNPFWPLKLPVAGVPYTVNLRPEDQRPPPLRDVGEFRLFFHSLFEIDHPTRYPNRERWIIDQGNAWVAFRMGGFWNVGVVTAGAMLAVLAVVIDRRKGFILCAIFAGLTLFVAVLPQSHELRYYQFLPLLWAAVIGMLLPRARSIRPVIAVIALTVVVAEFGYVSWVNRAHYRVIRVGYAEAANAALMPKWWTQMRPGRKYCAIGFAPVGIMLTGPTMREFTVVERSAEYLCPSNSIVLRQQ